MLFLKSFLIHVICVFAFTVSSHSADEETLLSPSQAKSQKQFTEYEQALIQDKQLNLRGVALFCSHDLAGAFITLDTHSSVSHIGLRLGIDGTNEELCLESTGSPGQIFKGILPQVQIDRLDDVVARYNGDVWTRDLMYDSGFEPATKAVTALVHLYLGRPYETNFKELLGSVSRSNEVDATDHLFCSELVALVLKDLGHLPKDLPANDYVPDNFTYRKEMLHLINVKLGDQIPLKTLTTTTTKTRTGCCELF